MDSKVKRKKQLLNYFNGRRNQFKEWLKREIPEKDVLSVDGFFLPTEGLANVTLIADILKADGERDKIVIRVAPAPEFRVLPFYDIGRQYAVLKALNSAAKIKVPMVYGYEKNTDILGEEFYVMHYVAGDTPSLNPPYARSGFVAESTPSERRKLWLNGLTALAEIHKIDTADPMLTTLNGALPGASSVSSNLAWYETLLLTDCAAIKNDTALRALDVLKKEIPDNLDSRMCWGDARLGNLIFLNNEVAAVIDWEMASLGDPAQDVGWWLFFDKSLHWRLPQLPGMPSYDESVAFYENCVGKKLQNLAYHELFAGFRLSCLQIFEANLRLRAGDWSVGQANVILSCSPALKLLRSFL
jgi:aminoglycoside phosphotransferase (APT) family kinase protein